MQNPIPETHRGCPIDEPTKEWIDARASWLLNRLGRERVRKAPVILPTLDYFPRDFQETYEDTRDLLDLMCEYSGLPSHEIALSLYYEQRPFDTSTMTSGLYHRDGDRFRIWIEVSQLGDPLGVAATMAHELGHVYLLGYNWVSEDADDHEPLTDLLTVFLGLGVITANASLRETHTRQGRWLDWQVYRHGYLTMAMYGYALALYAKIRDEVSPEWPRHLRPDVRQAYHQSLRYLDRVGLPELRKIQRTRARPSLGEHLSLDDQEVDPDLTEEDIADDTAICTFCGITLPHLAADGVCTECQDSILENEWELEEERISGGRASDIRYLWLTWGAVAVVALIVFSLFWEWLRSL